MAESRTAIFKYGFEVFVIHDKKHIDDSIDKIDECAIYDYMDCIVVARMTYFSNGEITRNVLYSDYYDSYSPDNIADFISIIADFFKYGFVK